MKRLAPGLLVWAAALVLALALPGRAWRGAQPPPFPFHALLPWCGMVGALVLLSLGLAMLGGPRLARCRALAFLETPPELLWAGLLLALWPRGWGSPGSLGLAVAFLAASLPTEVRWLAAGLPPESPFPEAWNPEAGRTWRWAGLRALAPRWLAARIPLWLTAALVLEGLLGLPGLGSDWMRRVALRDRPGMAAWVLGLALLWLLARPLEAQDPVDGEART